MHRLITGAEKGKEVDHVNHDTLDNRRSNLRVGSHLDNMRNGRYALATHCPKGHPYDAKNTYFDKRGRRCRQCATDRMRDVLTRETPDEREHRRTRVRAYHERTKETRLRQMREYAEANKEKRRAYFRKWRAERKART